MPYKIYNELPGVGTAARFLISVILYNVCNVIEWGAPGGAQRGTGAILHAGCQRGHQNRVGGKH